jgi:hypothetical protein
MSTDPYTPVDVEDEPTAAVDSSSTLLAHVREQRDKKLAEDHYLDVDLPGYDGLLVARFVPFPVAKSERAAPSMRKKMDKGEPILLDSACDTLINACEQIMVRKPGETDPIAIDDENPVRFDSRLAELIGLGKSETSRQVVKDLFFTEQGIIAVAMTVDTWMRDVTKEADEEFLGN